MIHRYLLALALIGLAVPAFAAPPAKTKPPVPKPTVRTQPVGFPQDAGAHDADAAIEWWYFNAFLKTESGKNYSVVGSFFRTGITATNKGHYLIYSLTDLDTNKVIANASILDQANASLMKSYLPLIAMQRPDDTSVMQLLAALQKNELPTPHRIAAGKTSITLKKPRFHIAMDSDKYSFTQKTDDARNWNAQLHDPAFSVALTFIQPKSSRPPMRVGGKGMTGLGRPDDMFYLSLTHTDVQGKITVNGTTESVTGIGWIDRQWGRSWIVGDNGWDWFGVHLSDGSDLIVYQIKANTTGTVLRSEATLLRPDGTQIVDKKVSFTTSGNWTDPASGITFPETFTVTLNTLGHTLTFTPAFNEQAIPTIGIGTAFWEGIVNVTGTTKEGTPLAGQGYRELVGYKPRATP